MKNSVAYVKHEVQGVVDAIDSLCDWLKGEVDTALADNDVKRAFVAFDAMREANVAMDAARVAFGRAFESYNKSTMPEFLDKLGTDMLRVPELSRSFYTILQHSASVQNKDAAFDWLRSNGGESLIQPTVNASTLKSFCKSKLEEEGVEPPEDAIKINTYRIIGSSKYTVKKDT